MPSDTLARLLKKVDPSYAVQSISCVVVSKSEQLLDPVHEVPLDAPLLLCERYGSNVCYHLDDTASGSADGSGRNLLDVLMGSRHERLQPSRLQVCRNYAFKSTLTSPRHVNYEIITAIVSLSRCTCCITGEVLQGNQQVRNAMIDLLVKLKVGWAPDSVGAIGEKFVSQLTAALWYWDPHHERVASRSIHLPDEVSHYRGSTIGTEMSNSQC